MLALVSFLVCKWPSTLLSFLGILPGSVPVPWPPLGAFCEARIWWQLEEAKAASTAAHVTQPKASCSCRVYLDSLVG